MSEVTYPSGKTIRKAVRCKKTKMVDFKEEPTGLVIARLLHYNAKDKVVEETRVLIEDPKALKEIRAAVWKAAKKKAGL